MSSNQQKTYEKDCKYGCGLKLVWVGKTDNYGSTGFQEVATRQEHTHDRCEGIKSGTIKVVQVQELSQDRAKREIAEAKREMSIPGQKRIDSSADNQEILILLRSVWDVVKDIQKKQKQDEEIMDGIDQRVTLLIEKVGYPGPETPQAQAQAQEKPNMVKVEMTPSEIDRQIERLNEIKEIQRMKEKEMQASQGSSSSSSSSSRDKLEKENRDRDIESINEEEKYEF